MTDEIRWENPPPPKHGRPERNWRAIGDALRSRPGQWAIVGVCRNSELASNTAQNVRHGRYPALASGFEAAARAVDGEFRVYARYVGEATS